MAKNRKAITPIEYEQKGHNHAYRGTEAHGVDEPVLEWDEPNVIVDPDEVDSSVSVEDPPYPVPIQVVDHGFYIVHHVLRHSLQAGLSQRVLPRDKLRTRFKMREVTGGGVAVLPKLIMPSSGNNANMAYNLYYQSLSTATSTFQESDWLFTQDEVWVLNPDPANVGLIEIYVERRLEDAD